jgi:hypothetical protein
MFRALTLSWPEGHIFPTYEESFQVRWDNSIPFFLPAAIYLTPWSRVLLEKITVNFAASQQFPRIYGTRKVLTVPTRARHLSLSWANSYLFLLQLRDTSSRNTPPRRSEWGSSLPPDCFVSRESISTWVILNIRFLRRAVVSTSLNPQAEEPPLVGCPRLLI